MTQFKTSKKRFVFTLEGTKVNPEKTGNRFLRKIFVHINQPTLVLKIHLTDGLSFRHIDFHSVCSSFDQSVKT
jgi:hypothetical protein